MAIVFSYTEATNSVEVTGGTSGTPATFADFVTADRAGTDTILLSAGAPANNLALTYAVRPVEDLALKVKCVVANKTAEADFIFITGKDWRGAAQTESIDVTAGNGSYTTTKYWSEITTLDCSDNAAGGGVVWADGDLSVTQDVWGVIWDYGDGQYRIDCIFFIGNDVASTYFIETDKQITFSENNYYLVLVNAVFQLGEKVGSDLGYKGCAIFLYDDGASAASNYNTGSEYLYGSYFKQIITGGHSYAADLHLINGVGEYFSSMLEGRNRIQFEGSNISINETIFSYWGNGVQIKNTSGTFSKIYAIELGVRDIMINAPNGAITLFECNTSKAELELSGHNIDEIITVLNPRKGTALDMASWGGANTDYFYLAWTCNIHITDKDGTDLAGVIVDCEDKDGTAVWAAGTITTNAGGDIAEQNINYIRYGDGVADLIYSPHKFTISKAGYETLVLDNITVDHPIVWHLELLDELAEGDVRDGVAYGEDSEGNLELPAVGDVESGVGFGSNGVEFTGDFEVPAEADVRDGEGYGAGGAEFEGDLDLPAIGDVEKGVQFDSLTKTGTFKIPAEPDVRDGEGYGEDDTEFTGTLDLPAEADVEDGVVFDGATKEGNFEAPAETDVEDGIGYGAGGAEFTGDLELPAEDEVEVGVGYGSLGTEFEGTYLGLRGNNLTAVLEKSVALTGHLEKKVSLTGELKS